jgi:hypothetical protein
MFQKYDVLCGYHRGNHVGSRRFAVILSIRARRFVSANSRLERKAVAAIVVNVVKKDSAPLREDSCC